MNPQELTGCAQCEREIRDKVLDVIQEDINDFCKDMNRRLAELRQAGEP
jgi:hypothetical protein